MRWVPITKGEALLQDRSWAWAPALLCAGALLFALYRSAMMALDTYGIEKGAALYGLHCASCHGGTLAGQEDWQMGSAATKGWRAPPLDASGHAWMHDDRALFQHVRNGGSNSPMPAFGDKLSDNQIWQVFAFIRNTWPESVQAFQLNGDPYALLPAGLPANWPIRRLASLVQHPAL